MIDVLIGLAGLALMAAMLKYADEFETLYRESNKRNNDQ